MDFTRLVYCLAAWSGHAFRGRGRQRFANVAELPSRWLTKWLGFLRFGPRSFYTSGTHLSQVFAAGRILADWEPQRFANAVGIALSGESCSDPLSAPPSSKKQLVSLSFPFPHDDRRIDAQHAERQIEDRSHLGKDFRPVGY